MRGWARWRCWWRGDGRLDQVYRGDSSRVDVRRGDGAGHFAATRQILPVPGESLNGAVLAEDLDGDGDVDVVAGGSSGALVWLNDGSGGFAQPFAVETPSDLLEVTVADVDEDGVPDLLALSRSELGEVSNTGVSVALGDGAGGFADPVVHPTWPGLQGSSTPIGVADIDGDGHADVYGGFAGSVGVYVLLGAGDGSFGLPIASESGAASVPTLATADIDVDGHLDLVTESTVVFGVGDGRFVEPHDIVGGGRVVTDDIDGNGQPDVLAVTGYRLNVLLNHLDGARDHD